MRTPTRPGPKHHPKPASEDVDKPEVTTAVSVWNAANALTACRIVAAPAVAHFLLVDEHTLALATAGLAALTDAADGLVARHYKLQTTLGSYLDPLADKLLISCASGALAVTGVLPLWLVGVIVGRDAVFVAVAGVLRVRAAPSPWYRSVWDVSNLPPLVIQPLPVSKVNTAMQLALTVGGIVHAGDYGLVSEGAVSVLCVATASTTVASTLAYADRFFGLAAARRVKNGQR
jgi:cardiolipin synthase (CMP-forming)